MQGVASEEEDTHMRVCDCAEAAVGAKQLGTIHTQYTHTHTHTPALGGVQRRGLVRGCHGGSISRHCRSARSGATPLRDCLVSIA